jgi:hypothetical protein
MSDLQPPPPPPTSSPPPRIPPRPLQQRSGCATALMVIFGVILLLPGLCALIFSAVAFTGGSFPSDFVSLIVMGLLVGFAGVMLIRAAIRGPQS